VKCMKNKKSRETYWDAEAQEWRYRDSRSTTIVPVGGNQASSLADGNQSFSLEAIQATQYDAEQSALDAMVGGRKFRSKVKTLNKNLTAATEVANNQAGLVRAVMNLEKAKIDAQKGYEEEEIDRLDEILRHEKLRTDLMDEKKKQAELTKQIRELTTRPDNQISREKRGHSEQDLAEQEKRRIMAELDRKVDILEYTVGIRVRLEKKVRQSYSDRTEEEIIALVDILVDRLLVETNVMPE